LTNHTRAIHPTAAASPVVENANFETVYTDVNTGEVTRRGEVRV
jgi:hypothetical protein